LLKWSGLELHIESGTSDGKLLIMVTPIAMPKVKDPLLLLDAGFMWNHSGTAWRDGNRLVARSGKGQTFAFSSSADTVEECNTPLRSNFLALPIDQPLAIREGDTANASEVRTILDACRLEMMEARGPDELREIIRSCLAWDTIYDPGKDRVISPVSRMWNVNWGGHVLFCWDTYFAAWLAAAGGNRDLAYANAIAITMEYTPEGFVPNFAGANGAVSFDRSQPPVGAITFRFLHKRFGDLWPVVEVFDVLMRWNRWWRDQRDTDGYLCWGSNSFPDERQVGFKHNAVGVHDRFGAALESGLDNSPMYDDIPFDHERSQLKLADVGLTSLYVADCDALADLASLLGREEEMLELRTRADKYRQSLQRLWCEEAGIFLNLRLDTGNFSHRLSPTCFYPLLARAASPEQARRMMDEHLLNPEEFAGEWMIPSIARNDPAYADNNYWRGRIWAPLNFLVYLGLCQYDLPEERNMLAEKSSKLILKEWREHGHVYENYNADTGRGGDVENSDPFYHWGALLALIPLLHDGPGADQADLRLTPEFGLVGNL